MPGRPAGHGKAPGSAEPRPGRVDLVVPWSKDQAAVGEDQVHMVHLHRDARDSTRVEKVVLNYQVSTCINHN